MNKIHPDTLRIRRAAANLSQQQLADLAKVTKTTVSRIERNLAGSTTTTTLKRLAAALKVAEATLTHPPTADADSKVDVLGYRTIKLSLDADTFTSFSMASKRYGAPMLDQIKMAPLFFSILAEGSLTWRRGKVSEMREAAARLFDVARSARHLAYANSAYHAEDGAAGEEASIEARDLFGKQVPDEAYDFGFDPNKNNPFADYLRHLAASLDEDVIYVTRPSEEDWKTDGMPNYAICRKEVERLNAERDLVSGGNHLARYALDHGHAKIADIPAELSGDQNTTERIAWLIDQIPSAERERADAAWNELLDLINASEPPSGGSDA